MGAASFPTPNDKTVATVKQAVLQELLQLRAENVKQPDFLEDLEEEQVELLVKMSLQQTQQSMTMTAKQQQAFFS